MPKSNSKIYLVASGCGAIDFGTRSHLHNGFLFEDVTAVLVHDWVLELRESDGTFRADGFASDDDIVVGIIRGMATSGTRSRRSARWSKPSRCGLHGHMVAVSAVMGELLEADVVGVVRISSLESHLLPTIHLCLDSTHEKVTGRWT